MTRILVEPDRIQALSIRWQQRATELRDAVGRLSMAINRLDWRVRQANGVESDWHIARQRAEVLASQAEEMARYLAQKAQAFEEADRAGAAAIGQVAGAFIAARQQWQEWWRQTQPALSFPQALVQRLLRLGGDFVCRLDVWTAGPLGIAAGLAGLLVGHRSLLPTPPKWQKTLQEAAGRTGVAPAGTSPTAKDTLRRLLPANPAEYSSCALYAQARRPDLGPTGGDGGAYNYIAKYRGTPSYYRLPAEAVGSDLRTTPLRPGTAVVWDRGVHGADVRYGHVAIIEEVGGDDIQVSEAGWGNSTSRRIPADQLPDLHFIL